MRPVIRRSSAVTRILVCVPTSAELIPFPPPGRRRVDPAWFADAQHRLFTEANLHVGRSRIVHAVTWVDWLDGLTLPAPACRQGWAGTGAHGELLPTRWPITCRKCRRLNGSQLDQHQAGEQPMLFTVG